MATFPKAPPDALIDYEGVVIFESRPGQKPDALYEEICRAYPEHTEIEQDAKGNVYLIPPTGGESGSQEALVIAQLVAWSQRKGQGHVFGPSTVFHFPDGSKMQPDAAWASDKRVQAIPYRKRRGWIPVVPEFVIEVKSPSDVHLKLQAKMERWLKPGVALGWLIHPDRQEVRMYTAAGTETRTGLDKLRGTGPVKGLILDLRPIWQGLR